MLLAGFLLSACGSGEEQSTVRVTTVSGEQIDFTDPTRPTVALFVDTKCPISNRYSPAIQSFYRKFGEKVALRLVYPNSVLTNADINEHQQAYTLPGIAVADPDHAWVHKTGVRVTPEAAVFSKDGVQVYRGRIDDRFVAFDQQRPTPTSNDVADVVSALLAGKTVSAAANLAAGTPVELLDRPGIGCFLADLK